MIEQSVSLASNGVVKVPGYEQLVRFGYTKNRGVYRLAVTASGEWEGLTIRCFWHVPDGKDLCLFLGTLTAANEAVLSDGHELQCPFLDVLLIAKPDGSYSQRDKAQYHKHQGDGGGDKVKHCFHDLLLLSVSSC